MRDIEFRGKRTKGKEWVFGCLKSFYKQAWIDDPQHSFRVDPETVGEYIGLKDKNGVKIFEGDIMGRLFDDYDENTVIVYRKGMLCAKPVSKEKYRPLNVFSGFGWEPVTSSLSKYSFIVIGNIHDNPELLKEADNA